MAKQWNLIQSGKQSISARMDPLRANDDRYSTLMQHFMVLFMNSIIIAYMPSHPHESSTQHQNHSGTIAPTLLQKSHLTPRPPSHVYAFTISKSFTSPGSSNSVIFGAVALKLVVLNGVPPVEFKFNCNGCAKLQAGKFVAALPRVLLGVLRPFAMDAEMEGLFCVMKLPQIVRKARLKSGPWLGVGGPK